MQTVHISILIAYLAVMVAVGAWFSRRRHVSSGDDFMFAGRSLPKPVLIGTLLATWVGSGTIIGGANFAYTYGPLASIFFLAGTPMGILALYYVSRKVRSASRYTVPELLEARFGLAARMIAAGITLLAYTGIVAYQFTGGGYIISMITSLSTGEGTLLVAALVTFLAIGGGLFSVAWTDFLSALVIVFGLVVAIPLVIGDDVGGFGAYWNDLPETSTTWSGGLSGLELLGYFLPLFLLILADQNMYQRLTAAQDEGTARSSTAGFFFSSFLVTVPVALLGSAAVILMPNINPDTAILSLASEHYLPAVIGGLVLAGALAFIVTTGSSFLLSGASNVVYDGFARFSKTELPDASRLRIHRVTVLAIAATAYVLGKFFPSVLELQLYSYTVYGVALAPPVLAVLLWKRATRAGALTCMILGTVVTITWEELDQPLDVNSVLISLPVALVSLVGVSLLTKPSDPLEASVEDSAPGARS
ncbi:sodium:solute symporter family protein [Solicola gregarius]|uniref:Sodium:solute symporter family protein n=1 Tax=Solicola gregarius TaxID=2908642 RepID=A0AA46TMB2_9ACTN|nr:sodium:solute symporter family protein [Solicola gregarius]UYM07685.1 sodium:solute symporter family protein [Solicola gregarius]